MKTYNVKLQTPDGEWHEIEVRADEHILDVALEAGIIELPYSCQQGWCLSCAARVIEGRVNQEDSIRFYEQDREEGFALICTGKPVSDIVLKTHAMREMQASRKKHGLPYPRGSWGAS